MPLETELPDRAVRLTLDWRSRRWYGSYYPILKIWTRCASLFNNMISYGINARIHRSSLSSMQRTDLLPFLRLHLGKIKRPIVISPCPHKQLARQHDKPSNQSFEVSESISQLLSSPSWYRFQLNHTNFYLNALYWYSSWWKLWPYRSKFIMHISIYCQRSYLDKEHCLPKMSLQ